MKRKFVWLLMSSLILLALILGSCGTTQTTTQTSTSTTTQSSTQSTTQNTTQSTTQSTTQTTSVTKAPLDGVSGVYVTYDQPQYGGTLVVGVNNQVRMHDQVVGSTAAGISDNTVFITNEPLMAGDWTRGAAGGWGTYDTNWGEAIDFWEFETGCLAESWEIPTTIEGDTATLIYHIRKGINWYINPASEASKMVGGRELTADDVVDSLNKFITDERAYLYNASAALRETKITSPAPYVVQFEFAWENYELVRSRLINGGLIEPPEIHEMYGDMGNWKNVTGTGAFMLTDFVSGSQATFTRNPDYWQKDPIGPGEGNQLPYMDEIRILTIPDKSTIFTAMRTGKIDHLGTCQDANLVSPEEAAGLIKGNSELQWTIRPQKGERVLSLKLDEPPFDNLLVREAMMLAIDWDGISAGLYDNAPGVHYHTWPIPYYKGFDTAYVALDDPDMPAEYKELFSYNPEKAKQLLADAGYSSGFSTKLITENLVEKIDYYSLFTEMWKEIGAEVTIEPKEFAVVRTLQRNRDFEGMIQTDGSVGFIYKFQSLKGSSFQNASEIDDPVVNQAHADIQQALVTGGPEAAFQIYRDMTIYILPQVWKIPGHTQPLYTLWWPWVKNYNGEGALGYMHKHAFEYVWIDQNLKRSMGK